MDTKRHNRLQKIKTKRQCGVALDKVRSNVSIWEVTTQEESSDKNQEKMTTIKKRSNELKKFSNHNCTENVRCYILHTYEYFTAIFRTLH